MALAESVRARLFPEDASLPAVPRPLGSGRAQPQWDSLGTAADGAAAAADALAPPTWGHNGQGGQGLPAFSWRRRPRGHRPWSSLGFVRRRCTRSPESSGKGGAKVRRSCPCTSTRPASPQHPRSCLLPAQRVSQWPPITRHAFPTVGRTGNRQDHGTTPTTVATFLHPVITDEMRPYAHVGSETVHKKQRVTGARSEVGLQRSLKDETDKNN